MAKWIILSLFVFSVSIGVSSDAYARSRHSRPHFSFRFPLPLKRSAEPTPSYTKPIYQHKEHPLPRIYSVEKPLIDDAGIFRPLNIQKSYYRPAFYKYDQEKNQYSTPNVLHADARAVSTRRSLAVEIDGQIYYYNDGFFYKESGKHFIVVPPIINSIVETIPQGSANIGRGSHYEYNGVYFRKVPQGYQVVRSPMRAM